MMRAFTRACWRFRVWRITRQADNRLNELRAKREKAARSHKRVSEIDAEMRRIRNEGLRT